MDNKNSQSASPDAPRQQTDGQNWHKKNLKYKDIFGKQLVGIENVPGKKSKKKKLKLGQVVRQDATSEGKNSPTLSCGDQGSVYLKGGQKQQTQW